MFLLLDNISSWWCCHLHVTCITKCFPTSSYEGPSGGANHLQYSHQMSLKCPLTTKESRTNASPCVPTDKTECARCWLNAGSLLAHRRRRWANSDPALCHRLVFVGHPKSREQTHLESQGTCEDSRQPASLWLYILGTSGSLAKFAFKLFHIMFYAVTSSPVGSSSFHVFYFAWDRWHIATHL